MKKRGRTTSVIEAIQECFSCQIIRSKKQALPSTGKHCCHQIKLPCNIRLPFPLTSSDCDLMTHHQFFPDQTLTMPSSITPQAREGEGRELVAARVIPLKGHLIGCKHLEKVAPSFHSKPSSTHTIRLLSQSSEEESAEWNVRQEERHFRINRVIPYVPLN